MKHLQSNWGLYLALLFILANTFYHSRWDNTQTEAPISWDASGYYSYLPAVFIYKDIQALDHMPGIIDQYRPSPQMDQAFEHESGHYIFKYTLGQSLTYLPGFAIGHIWAKNSTQYPADGYAYPYQAATYFYALCFGLLGLFVLFSLLKNSFSIAAANWAIFALAAGTNLLEYASYTPMMTHISLFTLYVLLIRQSILFWNKPSTWKALAIGLLVGWLALIRPTELIAIIIPLLWGIEITKTGIQSRWNAIKGQWKKIGLAALAGTLVLFLQSIYWKVAGDEWIIYSYQDQGFSWLKPHIKQVLISYRKGWLVYTPMMIFGLVGFYPLFKRNKSIFLACLAFFLINFYIVSAWDIWWYGGSFGQRALVQSYAIMAFPLAAFAQWILEFKQLKWAQLVPVLFFVFLNNFQIWQSHTAGLFDAEYTNKAYYWRMFLNTNYEPTDKLLLDSKEAFFGLRSGATIILEEDFEAANIDSTTISPGFESSVSQQINQAHPYSYTISLSDFPRDFKWFRVTADYWVDQKEYDIWSMAALVVEFKKEGKNVKYRHIKFPRLLNSEEWKSIMMTVQFPDKAIDEIRCYVFLPKATAKIYRWDNIEFEVFNEL